MLCGYLNSARTFSVLVAVVVFLRVIYRKTSAQPPVIDEITAKNRTSRSSIHYYSDYNGHYGIGAHTHTHTHTRIFHGAHVQQIPRISCKTF